MAWPRFRGAGPAHGSRPSPTPNAAQASAISQSWCARWLRSIHAERRDRQRQDRGLPGGGGRRARARRPGADARARDQPDAAARRPRARRADRGARRAHAQRARGGRARAARGAPPQAAKRSSCSARGSRCSRRMPSLGLVVVDEEHDASYKQQDNVRYHARDAAIWRAQRRGVPVVLGSATPSLETWLAAREGRYRQARPARRAPIRAPQLPAVHLVAHRTAARARRHRRGAARGHRRRGSIAASSRSCSSTAAASPPRSMCAACKWEAECPRCSARLTAHRAPPSLRCHHCGHDERLPRACPSCGNVDLVPLGLGTQRLERALAAAFPAARIARVDRDSTRAAHAFASVRDKVEANAIDILVGTQMLAKGHDFPRLTLVGVLGARQRALQRRLSRDGAPRGAARAGGGPRRPRGLARRGRSCRPISPSTRFTQALLSHDYAQFADALLEERNAAGLPPCAHAALLSAEAHERDDVDAFLQAAHATASHCGRAHGDVEVFSPVAALLARRAGFERGQLVVQSAKARRAAAVSSRVAGAHRGIARPPHTLGARRRPGGLRIVWTSPTLAQSASASLAAPRGWPFARDGPSRMAPDNLRFTRPRST